ncbi:MAG: hypothetical protein QOI20_244 [Acidimicrobiaceae bacterium]|nr:hypothetical protein [Acidimicrobiaceae bacterium]
MTPGHRNGKPSGGTFNTIQDVKITLRLTEDERAALQEQAAREGVSMEEAAQRAVREYVKGVQHRGLLAAAARRVMGAHGEALDRLGR